MGIERWCWCRGGELRAHGRWDFDVPSTDEKGACDDRLAPTDDRGHAHPQPRPTDDRVLCQPSSAVRRTLRALSRRAWSERDSYLSEVPRRATAGVGEPAGPGGRRAAFPLPDHAEPAVARSGDSVSEAIAAGAGGAQPRRGGPIARRGERTEAADGAVDGLCRGTAHVGGVSATRRRRRQRARRAEDRARQGPQGPFRHALAASARDRCGATGRSTGRRTGSFAACAGKR